MCGIAGFADLRGGILQPPTHDVLRRMAEALRPRGPDDMQFVVRDQACMSFTRLSLIDPEGGRQPFVSADGQVIVAANGEVYNHRELRARLRHPARFRSESDCEVLLHLYEQEGLDFLRDVRGMFGIAVIDLRRQRLLLARDRLGIKPLYVHRADGAILFGSEIKALFEHPACPRELDWGRALRDQSLSSAPVMELGEPLTWFTGVEHVRPATIMEISLRDGATREHVYWRLPESGDGGERSVPEYADALRAVLDSSVRECLVADAEVGLLLSGGIDSAGVAALAGDHTLHTFTALNGGTLANGDAGYARRTAELLDLPHHMVAFGSDRVPSTAEWLRLLWIVESPLCGPEQFYKSELYRHARIIRPEMKAVLLGSGADEFSGGYSVDLSGGGDWADFQQNLAHMSRRSVLGTNSAMAAWWEDGPPLLREDAVVATHPELPDDPYRAYLLWKMRDMQMYNLWTEDRTASGNAVEARVPFLDHRVIELLAGVPRSQRRELFWNKRIVRDALAGVLPEEVRGRRKIPFFHGAGARYTHRTFARMLTADGEALLDQALSVPRSAQYLDATNLVQAVRDLADERSHRPSELVLRLVNLGLLDAMASGLPVDRNAGGAPPYEIRAEDLESEATATLLRGFRVEPGDRFRLAPEVLVLDDPQAPASYVAVDGELRYVIDHDTDAQWLRLLRSLDGRTPVAELADRAGCELDQVRGLLEESVEGGVIEAVAVDPAGDDLAPTMVGSVSS